MSTSQKNHPNNLRLHELIRAAQLDKLATAMTVFNRGLKTPIKESEFKGWLAEPHTDQWVGLSDMLLAHAEDVFGPVIDSASNKQSGLSG